MKRRTIITIIVMLMILVITSFWVSARETIKENDKESDKLKDMIIVVNAGHGGNDPGKVGKNNIIEADINLAIALKLEVALKEKVCQVIMTRTDSNNLSKPEASNKKTSDMKERIRIMEEAHPEIILSIHQNSYGDSQVKGAQVFYHSQSKEGEKLAKALQDALVNNVDASNKRKSKEGDDYYLLRKSTAPAVIIECGFLSNPTETALLVDDGYQEKIADAIIQGILNYKK